jgi:hypothetical protein
MQWSHRPIDETTEPKKIVAFDCRLKCEIAAILEICSDDTNVKDSRSKRGCKGPATASFTVRLIPTFYEVELQISGHIPTYFSDIRKTLDISSSLEDSKFANGPFFHQLRSGTAAVHPIELTPLGCSEPEAALAQAERVTRPTYWPAATGSHPAVAVRAGQSHHAGNEHPRYRAVDGNLQVLKARA